MNDERPRLTASGMQFRVSAPGGFFGKLVAVVLGTAVLAAAFVFSIVLLVVLLAGGLIFGGYLWWKTRDLRKQLRAQQQIWAQQRAAQAEAQSPQAGQVYEGEVIRETDPQQRSPH